MSTQDDQQISISPHVLFQEISGEAVLLDLASENYFGLDTVGTRVWQLLNEGSSVSDIVETLLGEYEVERETLEADVANLLDELKVAGLVRSESVQNDNTASEVPGARS